MKRNDFFDGIKDGLPICFGYFSVSMAFGIAAIKGGLPIWAAILTSLSNLTSAGQFAGVSIMLEHGSLIELAVTTLIINIRYLLMSLSVSQNIDSSMKLRHRYIVSFGITDEVFAVSMQRIIPLTAAYMLGLIITPVFGWTLGTALGAIATSVLPVSVSSAMGIALYGMFIAIIIPPSKENNHILAAVIISVVSSLVFSYAPILKNISSGWTIILITIAVSALCATIFPLNIEEEGNEI